MLRYAWIIAIILFKFGSVVFVSVAPLFIAIDARNKPILMLRSIKLSVSVYFNCCNFLKVLLGMNYDINKFTFILNNTYFGEVKWQHATDPAKDQTFSGKVITDLGLSYRFTSAISANVMVNNLFNVYPDVIKTKGDVVTDLGGRFKYAWEVNQFGFSGTIFTTGLNWKF